MAAAVETAVDEDHPGQSAPSSGARLRRLVTDPTAVHVASLAIAFVVLLVLNRHNWFSGDDWDFLGQRRADAWFNDLWRPHVDHWSTVPLLVYRVLFAVFGLRTMWPYLVLSLLAHLGVAHLAWRVARSEGGDAWIATALTAIFLLLGSGAENLTWTFQTTTNGALFFGYLAVVLATTGRSGPGRTVGINVAAVAAVMSSAVGAFLAGALAIIGWQQGRWRGALRLAGVPVGLFVVWYGLAGRTAAADHPVTLDALLLVPKVVGTSLIGGLDRNLGLIGAGTVALAAISVWVLVRYVGGRAGGPAFALAAGLVLVLVSIGIGRVRDGVAADGLASRYTYVAVAMALPLLVLALTDLATWLRARAVAPHRVYVGLAVLAVVVGAQNLAMLRDYTGWRLDRVNRQRHTLEAGVALALRDEPLLDPYPEPVASRELDADEARRLVAMGALPVPPVSAADLVDARLHMQVAVGEAPVVRGPFTVADDGRQLDVTGTACTPVSGGTLYLRPVGSEAAVALDGLAGVDQIHLRLVSPTRDGTATRTVDRPGGGDRVVISSVAAGHELQVDLPDRPIRVCGEGAR